MGLAQQLLYPNPNPNPYPNLAQQLLGVLADQGAPEPERGEGAEGGVREDDEEELRVDGVEELDGLD